MTDAAIPQPMPIHPTATYTADQVATWLHIGINNAHELISSGQLKAAKPGKTPTVLGADLLAYYDTIATEQTAERREGKAPAYLMARVRR